MLRQRYSSGKLKRSRLGWQRWGRYFYLRLLRLREHPTVIARGVAVGVFAGCFPLFGLQTIIGVSLAFVIRGSKLAAAAGTWVSNPLTYVPLFAFNYKIGQWLLGQQTSGIEPVNFQQRWESWSELRELGTEVIFALFYGSFWVGIVASVLAYFLSLRIMKGRKLKIKPPIGTKW